MSNNRMHVSIAGVSLTISTTEEELYVERLIQAIDEDMQNLLSRTKASVTSAALLLALDYLDRYQKANVSATNMRTQIKGYLTDAANAKLLFDEEKKRSDMYAREIGELNSRLENVQVNSSRSEDIKKLMEEHNALIEERANILNQLDYANNLLSTTVAAREEETANLKSDMSKYAEQLDIKTNQLLNFENLLNGKQDEIDKLLSEVSLLQNLLKEYINEEKSSAAPLNQVGDFGSLRQENPVPIESPPLFNYEPPKELPYEYDDMPNLNWTENL